MNEELQTEGLMQQHNWKKLLDEEEDFSWNYREI